MTVTGVWWNMFRGASEWERWKRRLAASLGLLGWASVIPCPSAYLSISFCRWGVP